MPRRTPIVRRLLSGGTALTLAITALVATPAIAAETSVTTISALESALADCAAAPDSITLGADILNGGRLTVPCDTTISLGSYDLTVSGITIGPGRNLTIAGPIDGSGGTLTAKGSPNNEFAGIRTSGATLTVTGGTVTARGSAVTAAIGGDAAAATNSGGTLVVAGGTVNASVPSGANTAAVGGGAGAAGGAGGTVVVSSGTLTATADGNRSTAVGGGDSSGSAGAAGAAITVGQGAILTATNPRGTVVGGGRSGGGTIGAFGSLQVEGTLRLPAGQVSIGTGTAGVSLGGRIEGTTADPTVGATFDATGTIANQGSITLNPPAEIVTGLNRLVRFSTGAPSVRLFAPSFAQGARVLPAPPAGASWNTSPDGTGQTITATSSIAGFGTLDLYAIQATSLVVSSDPAALTAVAGQPYTFPVTVQTADGSIVDPQPTIDYTAFDCTLGENNVFTVAGSCLVGANTTQGPPLTKYFTVTVVAGPVAELAVAPVSGTGTAVAAGDTVQFAVTGTDAYGNSADTSAAVLTSSRAADVVDGRSVTFTSAGARTITATQGTVSASNTVDVSAAPTPTPTPTVEPTQEPSPSPTPTVVPTASPTPTASPSPTVESSPSPTPTVGPSPSPTPTVAPTASPTPTVEPSPTPTVEPSPSPTPTVEPSPSPTPKPTIAPTGSPTPKPTATPKPTPKPPVVKPSLRRVLHIVVGVLAGWLGSGGR